MKKDKKETKEHTWKYILIDYAAEFIFILLAMGIGFGIALLLPYDAVKDIPGELFFLVGLYVLCAVIGIVALTVYLVKRKKKMKDLKFIYKCLKDDYNLTLITVSRNVNGKTVDIPIIKAKTSKVSFELLKEGQAFSFSIEHFGRYAEERYSKVCVNDIDGAIEKIKEIMSSAPI